MVKGVSEFYKEKEHILILKALEEIPFPVGKKLLLDFVLGECGNNSIENNELDVLDSFGCLNISRNKAESILDFLIDKGLVDLSNGKFNPFMRVLKITEKGFKEMENKEFSFKDSSEIINVEITLEDRENFERFKGFLGGFNDEQMKGIISNKNKILCIAGAGSGKTSVLTKRIEFLIKYKNVDPKKILAITFTRKAREEMLSRLLDNGVIGVNIETFNSFGERVLKKYWNEVYGKPLKIISYAERIIAFRSALEDIGLSSDEVIEVYFNSRQKDMNSSDKLFYNLMNDCFFVLDYYKSRRMVLDEFYVDADEKHKKAARIVYKICKYLINYMELHGLRDYTDQILDCVDFFSKNKESIPEFDYLFVDEYQDVNSLQIEMIEKLKVDNLFFVGDPRQSIFGWRGSDIRYILDLTKIKDFEVIYMNKNYRSNLHIVNFVNHSIRDMALPDLSPVNMGDKEIYLHNFDSPLEENYFVLEKIKNLYDNVNELFVLARTNKQLNEISNILTSNGIKHYVKSEDAYDEREIKSKVVLATIHAIKGLEADAVFIIGCNKNNFPSKASDHPVIDLIKVDSYNKLDEEKRLFYVALSRAKSKLYMTYSGKLTSFMNPKMIEMSEGG